MKMPNKPCFQCTELLGTVINSVQVGDFRKRCLRCPGRCVIVRPLLAFSRKCLGGRPRIGLPWCLGQFCGGCRTYL
jgi:hypothetical protein